MARPRKASDEDVFAAALRLMNRLGPTQWTLGDVARDVGLTPSALVQRFGSKRDLQVALMEQWAGSTPGQFAALRRASSSALTTLYAYARVVARLGESPGGFAHHLAYLQMDLSDPDMHSRLRRQTRDAREAIRSLLDEAIAAGELAEWVNAEELAHRVEVTLHGSLMVWGVYQDGSAAASLRRDLDALLEPYRPGSNPR